jgi:O-antigen/teichoic acid export membrane protein
MSLRRIAKSGGSLLGGQGVTVISQLLLPPIFLHQYGIATYGEWLTLSAAVGYLGTLNFGLQTFANNQVAICYSRGELEEAKTLQATAMLVLLLIVFGAASLTLLVFLLPVDQWLGLKISRVIATATLYLLGLQILLRMLFGFLVGTFLVIGVSYRGANWSNAASLTSTLATALMALEHGSFVWIAVQQLLWLVLFCGIVLIDLRKKAPVVFPKLRYARPGRITEILKPSGYFGMLFWSNFLVYQLPVILMQRILGPSSVVVFSITRTIYSMSRQALTSMTQALGQEITELYGKHAWARLFRLYELSERVIFALIPVVTMGTLLATPLLITVWLHKTSLYDPYTCIIMALISGAMGIKEHKSQFQTSTNQHSVLARMMFWSYLVMVALAVPGIRFFGSMGFLVPWLITEVVQVIFIVRLNQRLFATVLPLEFTPLYKLFAFMGVATLPGAWFAIHATETPLLRTAMTALIFVVILGSISYPLFELNEVKIYLRDRSAMRSERSA